VTSSPSIEIVPDVASMVRLIKDIRGQTGEDVDDLITRITNPDKPALGGSGHSAQSDPDFISSGEGFFFAGVQQNTPDEIKPQTDKPKVLEEAKVLPGSDDARRKGDDQREMEPALLLGSDDARRNGDDQREMELAVPLGQVPHSPFTPPPHERQIEKETEIEKEEGEEEEEEDEEEEEEEEGGRMLAAAVGSIVPDEMYDSAPVAIADVRPSRSFRVIVSLLVFAAVFSICYLSARNAHLGSFSSYLSNESGPLAGEEFPLITWDALLPFFSTHQE